MMDIDFFKKVNDTYGHFAGDTVLKAVSNLIKNSVREYDIPNRYGGEEFIILLPSTKVDEAYAVAERLRRAVEATTVDVPDENIVRRMSGRRACVTCGATYHIEHVPPKTEGICDKCGSELILRDDDKEETVKNRLSVYHDQTQPLIDFYSAKGVLKNVDGTVDMMDVFNAITNILG